MVAKDNLWTGAEMKNMKTFYMTQGLVVCGMMLWGHSLACSKEGSSTIVPKADIGLSPATEPLIHDRYDVAFGETNVRLTISVVEPNVDRVGRPSIPEGADGHEQVRPWPGSYIPPMPDIHIVCSGDKRIQHIADTHSFEAWMSPVLPDVYDPMWARVVTIHVGLDDEIGRGALIAVTCALFQDGSWFYTNTSMYASDGSVRRHGHDVADGSGYCIKEN